MGTQDLGTGTRTCILMIAADTLGIPMDAIQLQIGDTTYPPSGGSGGSTTIGGVSSSTRRAAVDARDTLGRTPLLLAVAQNRLDVVRLLLARGADPNAADNAGLTPLQQAKNKDLRDVAALLQRAGAR